MKKGHTLIESVIVIVLVGIISFVFAVYIQEGFDAWKFLSGQKSITLASRAALNRMVREIKRANGGESLMNPSPSSLSFTDNLGGGPITFYQQGTDLYRNQDILLENLANPGGLLFTYLDKDGVITPTPEAISVVRCRLTIVKDANKFVVESAARIRKRQIN